MSHENLLVEVVGTTIPHEKHQHEQVPSDHTIQTLIVIRLIVVVAVRRLVDVPLLRRIDQDHFVPLHGIPPPLVLPIHHHCLLTIAVEKDGKGGCEGWMYCGNMCVLDPLMKRVSVVSFKRVCRSREYVVHERVSFKGGCRSREYVVHERVSFKGGCRHSPPYRPPP